MASSDAGMARLRAAAVDLRDAVSDGQRNLLCLPFADEGERRTWMYWPSPRKGLPLSDMTSEQCQLAYRMAAAVLSLGPAASAA